MTVPLIMKAETKMSPLRLIRLCTSPVALILALTLVPECSGLISTTHLSSKVSSTSSLSTVRLLKQIQQHPQRPSRKCCAPLPPLYGLLNDYYRDHTKVMEIDAAGGTCGSLVEGCTPSSTFNYYYENPSMIPLPDSMMDDTIFVGNLNEFCTDDDLSDFFSSVSSVNLYVPACVVRKQNGDSLRYGFVTFRTVQEKEEAVIRFHGIEFMGNTLRVETILDDRRKPRVRVPEGIVRYVLGVTKHTKQKKAPNKIRARNTKKRCRNRRWNSKKKSATSYDGTSSWADDDDDEGLGEEKYVSSYGKYNNNHQSHRRPKLKYRKRETRLNRRKNKIDRRDFSV